MIIEPIKQTSEQQVSTVFVDDTDFMMEGNDANIKMNTILETYTNLYEATRRVVQFEKTSYFYW